MNNDRLIQQFTRVKARPDGLHVECQVISWPHPHMPRSRWVKVETLAATTPEEEILAARLHLLKLPRFFGVCRMCRERQPKGWMHSERVCQSCAVDHLGVVY
ncbi:hypothetical protein [Prosthecobacter sp.]|uniref:hypothetical protein n=1 Tax=Prosthecobacter sp. TaxID=1965333 RepID=UPI00378520C8